MPDLPTTIVIISVVTFLIYLAFSISDSRWRRREKERLELMKHVRDTYWTKP